MVNVLTCIIHYLCMATCNVCSADLPADSLFCNKCGTQLGLQRDVYEISSEKLIGKIKEILNDARVKRVTVKDDNGKVLVSMPIALGAAGAVATVFLAPWLAALGVIAGIITHCKIEVERE